MPKRTMQNYIQYRDYTKPYSRRNLDGYTNWGYLKIQTNKNVYTPCLSNQKMMKKCDSCLILGNPIREYVENLSNY